MSQESPRRKFLRNAFWTSIISSWGFTQNKGWNSSAHLDFKNYSKDIKDHFLFEEGYYYFNTAGLGPTLRKSIEQYEYYTRKLELHITHGIEIKENCRIIAAEFFRCKSNEITFTRNATEGINIIASGISFQKGDEIIITNHEHVGAAAPWMHQAQIQNLKLKIVDLDITGKTNLEKICSAITSRTKVVAISHVTCSNGMILPVKEIIAYCRERNILTCIDGAQSAGMMPVDLGDMKPDFYATSGHKWLLGPKESGILYINKDSIDRLTPTFSGAFTTDIYNLSEQKYSYRNVAPREEYGTRNTAQQLALATAIEYIMDKGVNVISHHGKNLTSILVEGLKKINNIEILSPTEDYRSSILTFKSSHPNCQEKIIQHFQKEYNLRMRWIYEGELNAIRVSCAIFNNEEEIEYLLHCLKKEFT